MRSSLLLLALLTAVPTWAQERPPIYVTFLWHMHQPVYWPGESAPETDAAGRYPFSVRGVFDQRVGPYTTWPAQAVETARRAGLQDCGAHVSFSGALADNLDAWEAVGHSGYQNWASHWQQAAQQKTSGGNPRLDLIGFGYYHPLMPLVDSASVRRQIIDHREAMTNRLGAAPSRGLFPPENAFATHTIPSIKAAGVDWVLVDNVHMERAARGYPYDPASNLAEPHRADQRNADPGDWQRLNGLWAPTQVSGAWAHRPHLSEYVDPSTGQAMQIVVVPTSRYLGNEDGRGGFGALQYEAVMSQLEAANTDPNHPILIVLHHDGDNFGGGSEGYYGGNFQAFADWAAGNRGRFECTTVQDYLDAFPPAPDDVIHVEPGSWAGADNGDPEFLKWMGRPGADGYSPDYTSWSILTAAQHRVAAARASGADVSEAGELLGQSTASDYWYWDGSLGGIWDSHVARASARIAQLHPAPSVDRAAPSLFVPQRTPYNPGETEWGTVQPRDVTIWTYAYDDGGLGDVTLYYRVDPDGSVDPVNQVFAGGSWQSVSMVEIREPSARTTPAPPFQAARYEAKLSDLSGVLVDYYVEATDAGGRSERSILQHVWIGRGEATGGSGNAGVAWTPTNPAASDSIVIVMRGATQGARLHWGVNADGSDWQTPAAAYQPVGTQPTSGTAVETPFTASGDSLRLVIGPFSGDQAVRNVSFVIRWADDTWDNNGGRDYSIDLSGADGGGGSVRPFVLDGALDLGARLIARDADGRTLYADVRGDVLYLAAEPSASDTGRDLFLALTGNPDATGDAPWAKMGTLAPTLAFFAREGDSGWSGPFGATSGKVSATDRLIEATVTLSDVGVADSAAAMTALHAALLAYDSPDGGAMQARLPSSGAGWQRLGDSVVTADLAEAKPAALGLRLVGQHPVRGTARLVLDLSVGGVARVSVYDALGRHIAALHDGEMKGVRLPLTFDVSGWSPGVYFVRAEASGEVRTLGLTVAR